jgi:hypothetical protein
VTHMSKFNETPHHTTQQHRTLKPTLNNHGT